MTKKRLLLIGGFLVACICLPLGVAAMLPSGPNVTKANFDRIQQGMAQAEAEGIFGREGKHGKGWGISRYWVADDGSWAIIWLIDDCVTDKHWQDSNETFLNKIRRWLHLP